MKKSEDIEGYRGNEDVESILQFIGKFPDLEDSVDPEYVHMCLRVTVCNKVVK